MAVTHVAGLWAVCVALCMTASVSAPVCKAATAESLLPPALVAKCAPRSQAARLDWQRAHLPGAAGAGAGAMAMLPTATIAAVRFANAVDTFERVSKALASMDEDAEGVEDA